ncbi:MAG: trypsin-like serine protease, partial [Candidatus Brocadiales bacterium]|nr:trypsin-like serine protease [Candidatus Brocadiales bacterium]
AYVESDYYYRATAFLVSPYTALTNAHVVYDYDFGSWCSDVKIYPGQYETDSNVVRPYGGRNYSFLNTNTSYVASGEVQYDYGAIKFSTPFNGISTFMPLKFNFDLDNNNTILNISGYPAVAQGADTYSQWWDSNYSSSLSTYSVARYYMDTSGGDSGSPVWSYYPSTGNRYVNAIHSSGWGGYLPNGGPRLTSSNQALIESWVAWTPPSILKEIDFDPEFYLKKYSDLGAAGYSKVNVKDHWLIQGIYEGRQGSPYFDVKYYLQNNYDLKQAYGNDYYGAFTHWLNNGIYEGRQGSPYFDIKFYLQNNSDLKQVYGDNYYAAFTHWVNQGIYEGRQSSSSFDVKFYLQNYPDLKQVFGDNYYAAFTHWLINGISEGRQGVQ